MLRQPKQPGKKRAGQGLAMASGKTVPRAEVRWREAFHGVGIPRQHHNFFGRKHHSIPYNIAGVTLMPIFEYICKECNQQFEALVYGSEKAECPKCQSRKLEPQLSVFAVSAKSGSPSGVAAGPCGSCGDPRGPGSCSLPDL